MKINFSNPSSVDNVRVRAVPRNGKVIKVPEGGDNPTVNVNPSGDLTFCLAPKTPEPLVFIEYRTNNDGPE